MQATADGFQDESVEISRANAILGQMYHAGELSAASPANLVDLLQVRRDRILRLASRSANAVRQVVLPADVRSALDKLPFAQGLTESPGVWVGNLSFVVQDNFTAASSTTRLILSTDSERITVVGDNGLGQPRAGMCAPRSRVAGLRIGDLILNASTTTLNDQVPSSGCLSIGPQRVAVILFEYPTTNLPAAFTVAGIHDLFFGPSASMAAWVHEGSSGKATVTGDVFGPIRSDKAFTSCFPDLTDLLTTTFRVKPDIGDLTTYNRIIFVTPHGSECQAIGTTNSGQGAQCGPITLPNGDKIQASISQISTNSQFPIAEILPTLNHEISHSFGIPAHASGMAYTGLPLGFLTSIGVHDEYGDRFSTLGGYHCVTTVCTNGQLNPQHKVFLGWLDQDLDIQTVSATTTIVLQAYESQQSGPKAVRVQRPGTDQWLWLEYRQPIGFDATLNVHDPNIFKGVLIRLVPGPGYEGTRYTHILDFNPTSSPATFDHATLLAGQKWSDPYTPLTINVAQVSAGSAQVTIAFDPPCVTVASPSLSAAGGSAAILVDAPSSCEWAVSSDASWIKVQTQPSGIGNARISLNVDPNVSSRKRNAVLSVGRSVVAVSQNAGAQMLFSTFGLADASLTNSGVGVSGAEGYGDAVPFTPPITTTFSSAEVVVYVSSAQSSPPAVFGVVLMSDANGHPGTVLETLEESLQVSSGNQRQTIIAISRAHPAIQAGNQYWLGLIPVSGSPTSYYIYWASNALGRSGAIAYRSATNEWGVSTGTAPTFRVNGGSAPDARLDAAVNAANYDGSAIASGEILTLFGSGLGSPQLTLAKIGPTSLFPTKLDETSVLFDGIPAPLLYVSDGQLACVTPFSVQSSLSHIVVLRNGSLSNFYEVPVTASEPAIFTADGSGAGQGAILNEDGSVNSSTNPAKPGEVIVLFGTGGGAAQSSTVDGSVSAGPSSLTLPATVTIGGLDSQVLYDGAAPSLVAGVVQVNAVVPVSATSGSLPVILKVGENASSHGVTVAVR